jgi:hypothetical protein
VVAATSLLGATSSAASFCFNDDVVAAGIIRQIGFIDTQEKNSIALCYELSAGTNQDKIIVVIADYSD